MLENDKPSNKEEVLRKAVEDKLTFFEERRLLHKKRAFAFKILGISFSTITTVLLGLQGFGVGVEIVMKDIALFLSACVTIIGAWDSFFNHRELWVQYTGSFRRLTALKTDVDYTLAAKNQAEKEAQLDELYGRYRAIVEETHASWQQLRKTHGTRGV